MKWVCIFWKKHSGTYFRVTCYSVTKYTMVCEELATGGVAENNKVRHLEVVSVRSENHSEWRSPENIWSNLQNDHQIFFDYIQKWNYKKQCSSTGNYKMNSGYKSRYTPISVVFARHSLRYFRSHHLTKYFSTTNFNISLFATPVITGLSYRGFHHK